MWSFTNDRPVYIQIIDEIMNADNDAVSVALALLIVALVVCLAL